MKIYGIYSSNHSSAVKILEQFKKKNKKFAEFIKEKEALPDCQGVNLIGFLIKPVQRLTKYHLLFRVLFPPFRLTNYFRKYYDIHQRITLILMT
jgi:hypothetical protein